MYSYFHALSETELKDAKVLCEQFREKGFSFFSLIKFDGIYAFTAGVGDYRSGKLGDVVFMHKSSKRITSLSGRDMEKERDSLMRWAEAEKPLKIIDEAYLAKRKAQEESLLSWP